METVNILDLAKAIAKRHKLRTKNVNVLGSVVSALEELLPDIIEELNVQSGDEDPQDNMQRITHIRTIPGKVYNLKSLDNNVLTPEEIISTTLFERK